MSGERCRHDLIADQCAHCRKPPDGLVDPVVITSGGAVFHRSADCSALREGQRKATSRGQETQRPETVPLTRVLNDRSPCIPCFPDFAPPGTRLCWVHYADAWHKGLLTRWRGRDAAGRWEAWVAFVAEIEQLTMVLGEDQLRPRTPNQRAPETPPAAKRAPTAAGGHGARGDTSTGAGPASEPCQRSPRVERSDASAGERVWLDVPYADKEKAKAAGARWDPAARRWFAPRPGMAALEPWAAAPDLPDPLPGEDRTLGSGLYVDLVPKSCWFTNARSCLEPRDWERVRRMVVGRAGEACEICGAGPDRSARRWMEVHERWTYDADSRVQSLRRLICVCTPCHTATHFGYAEVRGLAEEAFAHLMSVTGMDPAQARAHIDEAFAVWEERSRHTWSLDLGMLTRAGINAAPPPKANDRVAAARAALDGR